jgi:poly-gamma-glutamate synthase PgsB/CapB
VIFISLLIIISIVTGLAEYILHISAVRRIPIRIHVNGSRGKSSVTRLIAGGLRAAGKNVIAKTTGSAPMIIYADGSQESIPRKGKPNINEILHFFRIARKRNADSVVVECMAILPELQKTTEHNMVKSTIGVITNVRPDHLGQMGDSLQEIAESLSLTIPKNATLFSTEKHFFPIFKKMAKKQNTQINPVELPSLTDDDMKGFPYVEHRENVSLALGVCNYLGIDNETALKGMYKAEPDIGVLRIYRMEENGRTIEFVNAFSANDPKSLTLIWEKVQSRPGKKIILVNTRRDRVVRSRQLGKVVAQKMKAYSYIITGAYVKAFINSAFKEGLEQEKVNNLEGADVEGIYKFLTNLTDENILVFAMGNFVNFGWEITKYFTAKSEELAYSVEL